MKKTSFLLLSAFMFLAMSSFGQSVVVGHELEKDQYPQLWNKFESFELFSFSSQAVSDIVSSPVENDELKLHLGDKEWKMELHPNDIHTSEVVAISGNGVTNSEIRALRDITFKGSLKGNPYSRVDITIAPGTIMGMVRDGRDEFFIENLRNVVEGAPSDTYIIYNVKDVIPDANITCGIDEVNDVYHKRLEDQPESGVACYEAVVALATDAGMATKHGGTFGAQAHVIGILVLVQTNFDNEFTHEIKLTIGAHFNASGTNPSTWNFSTIGSLLSSFRSWANANGFGTTAYDVATLWSSKSFGGVIGLAYLDVICGGSRYNVCVDYTSGSNGLRNLQAHELGHNFSLTHDPSGSPHIMAPAVNGSNTWSSQSKSQMNGKIPYPCMGACPGVPPPTPNFVANPEIGCRPMVVQFTDLSTGSPNQWLWQFPGGVPSSSTQQNPIVTYNTPGRYDVELEVTNGGGSSIEYKVNYIDVGDTPFADFEANVILDEVFFQDESIVYGVPQYNWDFGDGNFSTQQNPTHTYVLDGIYLVTLTVTNQCGSNVYQQTVEIVTPPRAEFRSDTVEMCEGTFITFTNLSSYNAETFQWVFEGGSPKTSVDENPTVFYDTAGTYKVELVARNARYQDLEQKLNYIKVDSHTVASFSEDVDSMTLKVDFTNETGGARSYEWDFGDGNTSKKENPSHTYAKDSTYEVTFITTNFCGSDTIVKTLVVGALPQADFSADENLGCLPHIVEFTDESSDNVTSRLWKFEGGDPASSTEKNPSVSYDQVGDYKVTLIVVNGLGGDTLVEEDYITIEDEPVSQFGFTRDGYEITFMDESTGANSYNWDFGDGVNSNEENPVHTYPGDGDYTVILIVTNNCGSDTMEQVVSLSNRPNANFIADNNQGCVPMTVQLENQSSGNSTDFEWLIPGGSPSSSTEVNPQVTFNNPGLYRVTLIANNRFGSDTVVKRDFIEVLDVPEAGYNFGLNGFTIDFANDSKYGKDFAWDFGDGESSDLENPTHVFNEEGVYSVTLIVSNICGSDTVIQDITVTPLPVIDFESDVTEICYGDTVRFEDNSANNPTSWQWTFEGGSPSSSTDQNPVVVYNTPGLYRVQLEATNQFGSNESTIDDYIRVYGDPVADYTARPRGIRANFTNESEEFGTFLWEFGDGETSSDFEPSHLYKRPGTYVVTLTVTNLCGEDVYESEISVKHEGVTFPYLTPPPVPNPTSGRVVLEHNGAPSLSLELMIIGLNGKIYERETYNFLDGTFKQEMELGHLPEGSYMIFYKTEKDIKMSKLVIQK